MTQLFKNISVFHSALLMAFILANTAQAQSPGLELHGQASAWLTYNNSKLGQSQIGLRYIPSLTWQKSVSSQKTIYAEVSFNGYGYMSLSEPLQEHAHDQLKPYRLWLRFSTAQFEARAGLQKINFGSAALLRPLMWFDRIDPRDPLQLTDGVYGLLLRYYTLNNANFWLWGLYGNDQPKGWEFMPTVSDRIEYGGRIQLPMHKGEIALSTHVRQIDLAINAMNRGVTTEERMAVDGKWDVGVGCWFEGALVHYDNNRAGMTWQRMANIGMDYTFALGNGLHILTEYLVATTGEDITAVDGSYSFSALSLSYPLGVVDAITAMFYYGWDKKECYRFFSWKRSHDRWQFFVLGYWNPQQFHLYRNSMNETTFSGRGLQLMLVFNH